MCAVPSCTTCVTAAASRHVSRKSCLRVSTRLQPPPPHKAQARPHKPLQRLPVAAFCFLAFLPPRFVRGGGVAAPLPAVRVQAQPAEALGARFAHPPQWEPEVLLEKKFMNREPARASALIAIVLREQPM